MRETWAVWLATVLVGTLRWIVNVPGSFRLQAPRAPSMLSAAGEPCRAGII